MAAAGEVTILLTANATSFSAAMTDMQRQANQMAGSVRNAGHSTVSSMQAASASIRLLENPMGNNIRAIERLISQSQVLSSVMRAAFPVVGAIAMTVAVVKLGSEITAAVEKIQKMPSAITQGFNALNLAATSSTDQLRLTNDRLQNEIDKLQGKPQNNLAISIDETRIAADKLATSLQSDADKVKQLLAQNQIPGWAVLLGKAGTASVTGSVNSFNQQIQDLGYQRNIAVSNGDTAKAADLLKQIDDKRNAAIAWSKNQLFIRDNPQYQVAGDQDTAGDQAGNRSILLGFQSTLLGARDNEAEESRNAVLAPQKAREEAQKAAATAAREAQKQAAEAQMQQWESDNSTWKAAQDRSLLEDAAWWKARLDTLNTGSLNYKAVNKKVNEDIIADNRQFAESIARFTQEYQEDFRKTSGLPTADISRINDSGKAAADYVASLRSSIDLTRQNGDAIAEYSLQMALATGQISKFDAAQALAAIHTQQFNTRLSDLRDERAFVQSDGSLTDLQRQARTAQIDNQVTQATGERAVQVQQDRQAINPAASLGTVGITDALNDFVTATRDAAAQMREITTSTLNSVNGEIVKAISGQRTNWGNAGAGIFRNVAGVGLQKAEGSILGGLGFGGKADGSRSNPLYVRMADSMGSAASHLASSIGGKSGGLLGGLINLLPHFAAGGPISANTLSVVGENGPELFNPGMSGSIIPNHALSSIGGSGGDTHYWNIDARGSTDPAQTAAQVQRGIQYAAPHIVAASQRASSEKSKRTPSSKR